MRRWTVLAAVAACAVFGSSAQGDLLVTLEARDASGTVITGDVAAGTVVTVAVLLAVDGNDNPLEDVRLVQFDFAATDASLVLGDFAWTFDTILYGVIDAGIHEGATPFRVHALSISLGSSPALLTLTDQPVEVATVAVTVNGSGTIDVGASEGGSAEVDAGFAEPLTLSPAAGNTSGGTLAFTVDGTTPPDGGGGGGGVADTDSDGVPDDTDAFPDDPDETTDTDGDGTGNREDTDDDGDGEDDVTDEFPLDPAETTDTDDDGVGDNADVFPEDPEESVDTDSDGVGDNGDAFPDDPDQTEANDDNSNAGPRTTGSFCGAGMLGSSIWLLAGLTLLSYRRRVGRRRGRGAT